jgi:hypothetical protein
MPKRTLLLALALATIAGGVLAGCGITNPYSQHTKSRPAAGPATTTPGSGVQNPGETPAPAPATPASQAPTAVQSTPERAIERFAELYINWGWRTLAGQQRRLATWSVGAARLAEQQAAAASGRDSEIARAQIYNRGQVISIAPSRTNAKQWVIVTREQTGGNSQYDGLQAAYHITLGELAQLPNGGYAISKWLPQN